MAMFLLLPYPCRVLLSSKVVLNQLLDSEVQCDRVPEGVPRHEALPDFLPASQLYH